MKLLRTLAITVVCLSFSVYTQAEIERIQITSRDTLSDSNIAFSYQSITGIVYFTLDPGRDLNSAVTDIEYAPLNADGLVEYSADFRLLVPSASIANGSLLYNVNNRGGNVFPPERSLSHPLSGIGFTYLATGWINELSPRPGRLRLHAPIVGSGQQTITGQVRYELSVGAQTEKVNIAGNGHLAYEPTAAGLADASLTRRLYQEDPRVPVERSQFQLEVEAENDSNQPIVNLSINGGFQPGMLYELIYEAQNPVLAGAGMAAIRDMVSAIRFPDDAADELEQLGLPNIDNTVAWGNSQSGRLLRQFIYDGFNEDLNGRRVFDGVIPVIAGSGYGMFNNRFAMPTRTNGQHSNYLYPNDLFPFTYGESTDPFTGRRDSILAKARASGTVPKLMHIQTSNEYWVRGGSLPHTNPQGTEDAMLPDEVRFYTIGGSQHGSGDGLPRSASSGQLPPNPNMWAPIADSLLVAMVDWVASDKEPPPSRYPRIADGSLVPAHIDGRINGRAWNQLSGINHPDAIYTPGFANYGDRWLEERIIDRHPLTTDMYYNALVPAVNGNNNDSAESTVLPPLTGVPLATFVPWNLRAVSTGAEKSLARLSGGYIPLPQSMAVAEQSNDPRTPIVAMYSSFRDYLTLYEAATDTLINEGYLLPEFKQTYIDIARSNGFVFD